MSRDGDKPRLVVLASGRGSNLQAILQQIDAGALAASVVAVISDQPGVPALTRAEERGIEAITLDFRSFPTSSAYHDALLDELQRLSPDLIVLAGYMRILPGSIVRAFPQRILNIHPSLLPAFPGLQAQKQAIEYGVKVSGCTVHFVDEGMDTGPIILQSAVPVHEDDTPETLAARILKQEHRLYPEAIGLVLSGSVRVDGRRVVHASEG